MRIEIFRRFVYLAIGSSLVLACSGCWPRPRHGVILRGDFALELNRIPWLKSRGSEYRSEEVSCGPESCSAQPAGPVPALMAPPVACVPRCNAMGSGGEVAQTGYHNEPRFHPVPTRPVFTPRGDLSDLVPRGPLPLPRAFATSPECVMPLQPGPGTDVPELIPPPPALRPSAKSDDGSAARPPASSVPAWVFSPPAPAESSDPDETAEGGWSLRR